MEEYRAGEYEVISRKGDKAQISFCVCASRTRTVHARRQKGDIWQFPKEGQTLSLGKRNVAFGFESARFLGLE